MRAPANIPKADFRRRWKRGDRVADMAQSYGVHTSTICRTASRMGLERRHQNVHKEWTNKEIKQLLSLRKKGMSHVLIAEKLGRPLGSVNGKSFRLKEAE